VRRTDYEDHHMYFSPFPCYLVPLRPKYFPEHPILKHLQPMFLPQLERLDLLYNCGKDKYLFSDVWVRRYIKKPIEILYNFNLILINF
jgi:hypothetical protein